MTISACTACESLTSPLASKAHLLAGYLPVSMDMSSASMRMSHSLTTPSASEEAMVEPCWLKMVLLQLLRWP